jgi:hypothetical protein
MEERRYKTAFIIAKISEIAGWALIIIGFLAGFISLQKMGVGVAFAIIASSVVAGLICVFYSQLILIFVDTENNTREAMNEMRRTNRMLGETLGSMSANLKQIAAKGGAIQ